MPRRTKDFFAIPKREQLSIIGLALLVGLTITFGATITNSRPLLAQTGTFEDDGTPTHDPGDDPNTPTDPEEDFDGYVYDPNEVPEIDYSTPDDIYVAERGFDPATIFSPFTPDEEYTIKEGKHRGHPTIGTKKVHWIDSDWDATGYVVKFNDTAFYDIASNPIGGAIDACNGLEAEENQGDWSKLVGQSWAPQVNAKKNVFMTGWRWFDDNNDGDRELQATFYYHDDDGSRYHGDYSYPDIPYSDISIDENYYIGFRLNTVTKQNQAVLAKRYNDTCFVPVISYAMDNYEHFVGQDWPEGVVANFDFNSGDANLSRQINGWFGGTCKAPQDITINRRLLDSAEAGYIFEHLSPLAGYPNLCESYAGPLSDVAIVTTGQPIDQCTSQTRTFDITATGGSDNLEYTWEKRRVSPTTTPWQSAGTGNPHAVLFERDGVGGDVYDYQVRVTVTDTWDNTTVTETTTYNVDPAQPLYYGPNGEEIPCAV